MSRGIEGEDHCCKKTQFIMEDVERAVKTGDFTGLSDKIFWRVYAAYQDGQMHMLIKQQEAWRAEAQKTAEKIDTLPEEICEFCGGSILDDETTACPGHHPREVDGERTPPSL